MSKHKFQPRTQTPPQPVPAPTPTETHPKPGLPRGGCPPGPWEAQARAFKVKLDAEPHSPAKETYCRKLADALAGAGKQLSASEGIYQYLIRV